MMSLKFDESRRLCQIVKLKASSIIPTIQNRALITQHNTKGQTILTVKSWQNDNMHTYNYREMCSNHGQLVTHKTFILKISLEKLWLGGRIHIWHLQGIMESFNVTSCSYWGSLKSGHHLVKDYTLQLIVCGPNSGLWYLMGALSIHQTWTGWLNFIWSITWYS